MNHRRGTRPLCTLLAAVLAMPMMPARADETIRCESRGFRYQYCRIDTNDRVELVRDFTMIRCREGRNWGYDRRGIWVDSGCHGEFRVGRGHNHDKAVVGAIVGLAALAAIASSRARSDSSEVAAWTVGRFSGYDDVEQVTVDLTIVPGGAVNGQAGSNTFTGSLVGNRLEAGRQVFRIERQGNGFSAVDERNASHRVLFQRTGSGY